MNSYLKTFADWSAWHSDRILQREGS